MIKLSLEGDYQGMYLYNGKGEEIALLWELRGCLEHGQHSHHRRYITLC